MKEIRALKKKKFGLFEVVDTFGFYDEGCKLEMIDTAKALSFTAAYEMMIEGLKEKYEGTITKVKSRENAGLKKKVYIHEMEKTDKDNTRVVVVSYYTDGEKQVKEYLIADMSRFDAELWVSFVSHGVKEAFEDKLGRDLVDTGDSKFYIMGNTDCLKLEYKLKDNKVPAIYVRQYENRVGATLYSGGVIYTDITNCTTYEEVEEAMLSVAKEYSNMR